MTLDPAFIKQLLAKPERKPSTRSRKPKTDTRDIDTWFDLNRSLGSHVGGECTIENCATLAVKGTRHAVTVDIPINPITTLRMCRRCFLAGVGKEDTDLDKR